MTPPRQDLAPLTPPIPLATLLALPDLGLRQVAGPSAADRDVRVQWVHTSEMEDPFPYLLGGELLLTAGVHFASAAGAGAYLDRYVARTVEAEAAALGFGLAPVHDETPAALVAACDRHGLPLVEVPPRTPSPRSRGPSGRPWARPGSVSCGTSPRHSRRSPRPPGARTPCPRCCAGSPAAWARGPR